MSKKIDETKNMDSFFDEYFTFEQMAQIMGLKPKGLRNRISAGKNHPPYFRPSAGVFLFPKKDFAKWRDSRIVKAVA
jgi:hypothetical protein